MQSMFSGAASFNADVSNWDVSVVADMRSMFSGTQSFTRTLCGVAWVESKAKKTDMFKGSAGSISPQACRTTTNHTIPYTKQFNNVCVSAENEDLLYSNSPSGDGSIETCVGQCRKVVERSSQCGRELESLHQTHC